jgi:hypothetical protein
MLEGVISITRLTAYTINGSTGASTFFCRHWGSGAISQ